VPADLSAGTVLSWILGRPPAVAARYPASIASTMPW
jgi:hypothetical protein